MGWSRRRGADGDAADSAGDDKRDGPSPGAGPTGARIIEEANYERVPNGDGELGMTVAADQRGWLGPYLLDALVEAAAVRGVPKLEADVLMTNAPMLTLLRSRGYATVGANDWATLRLVVGTAGRVLVWPPTETPPPTATGPARWSRRRAGAGTPAPKPRRLR